jgi:hypothetical protein
MSNHFLNDPERWRQRARALRQLAHDTDDPESKRMILNIADEYEKLAKRAEERSA